MAGGFRRDLAGRSGTGLKISAVIPANNEQSTIGEVVEGCKRYCDEVIVVDDASSDLTSEVARRAGAKVTRNAIRLGIVRSTEIGLRLASKEIVVTLDGDGQHDPSEIPVLANPIIHGYADLVLGRRALSRPFSERIISSLTWLRVRCEDVGSGYRAFRLDLAHSVKLWGHCLCGSLALEAREHGARIVEVPITIRARQGGKSHWPSPLSRGRAHCIQIMLVTLHLLI